MKTVYTEGGLMNGRRITKFIRSTKQNHDGQVFYEEEVQALLAVLEGLMARVGDPGQAVLIFDTQRADCSARLGFRLQLGEEFHRHFFRIYSRTGTEIAEESIDAMLEPFDEKLARYGRTDDSWFDSGIYRDAELTVMLINATGGRFLVSFTAMYSDNLDFGFAEHTLLGLALALAQMAKEDEVLQQSVQQIHRQLIREAEDLDVEIPALARVEAIINRMFECHDRIAIQEWYNWHEPVNSSGNLELFFD